MTVIEGITGLVASVCAIIGALYFTARHIARRFDRWADATIENSRAVRELSSRVKTLEGAIDRNGTP